MRKLLLIALLPLVGCVTPGPQQKAQQRPTARDDPSYACFSAIANDERFVRLREKMAVNLPADKPSLEMLADRSTPTAEEKKLISLWVATRQSCSDAGASFRAQYAPPEYRANTALGQTAVNNLAGRLYAGEISFGEFNRLRAENSAVMQSRMANTAQREREAAAVAAAQDEANRRAAVAATLQNMQTQQLIQQQQQIQNQQMFQQSRPTTTNCQQFGNQVNCTTR